MSAKTDEVIGVLNGLVETAKDGEEGFKQAADNVKDEELKALFNSIAQERAEFANDLNRCVRSMGGDSERRGSMAGAAHRVWMDTIGTLTGKSDHAILSEVERGEDAAVKEYEEATKKSLPPSLADVISRQYRIIKSDHDKIKRLRDAKSASAGKR